MSRLKDKLGIKSFKNKLKIFLSPSNLTYLCLKWTHLVSTHLGYYHIRPVQKKKVVNFKVEDRNWKNFQIHVVTYIRVIYGLFKIATFPLTYEVYGVSSILALHFISLIHVSLSIGSGHNAQNKFINEVCFIHSNLYKLYDKFKADGKDIRYWWEHRGPQVIIINTVVHYWMTRIVYAIVFLIKPHGTLYAFRFLPEIVQENYLALFVYSVFEFWIAGSWLDVIIITGSIGLEYQIFAESILKVLRYDEVYSYDYKIQIYRKLQILNRMFGQYFSDLFFFWQVICAIFTIIAIYVTLYLFNSMHLAMWLLFPLSIVSALGYTNYIIGQFSKLDEQSLHVMENFKQKYTHFENDLKLQKQQLFRRAQINSLEDLEMHFGQFGLMSPEVMLFVTDQIVGNFLTLKDAMGK